MVGETECKYQIEDLQRAQRTPVGNKKKIFDQSARIKLALPQAAWLRIFL